MAEQRRELAAERLAIAGGQHRLGHHYFEKRLPAHPAASDPHGHGIGLTLVQEVLMAHGCEFGLEGPPGGPTRFRAVFPA